MNAANGNTVDFNADNATTDSFKTKDKITGKTGDHGTKNIEIMVTLKYLSNFRITLEIPSINCKLMSYSC